MSFLDQIKQANVDSLNHVKRVDPKINIFEDKEYWEEKTKIHEVAPNLFLTCAQTAGNLDTLEKAGITHILIPATLGITIKEHFPNKIEYLNFDIDDQPAADIYQYFAKAFTWMKEVLSNPTNKILVHCALGVSRSASFVIGYLMATKKQDYVSTFVEVRKIRSIVSPNSGFQEQLERLERESDKWSSFNA